MFFEEPAAIFPGKIRFLPIFISMLAAYQQLHRSLGLQKIPKVFPKLITLEQKGTKI